MNDIFTSAKSISIRVVYERYTGNKLPVNRYHTNVKCPFHGEDTKPSMHLYENTNTYHCFACGKHGSTIDFIKDATGISDNLEAAKQLCEDFNIPYTTTPVNPEYKQYTEVYSWVAKFYNFLLKSTACPNKDYFKDRGFESIQSKYLLGYCPSVIIGKENKVLNFKEILLQEFPNIPSYTLDSYDLYDSKGDSIMAGRYVFPIFDSKGNVVAFSGRSLDPNASKYLNTKETTFFKKRNILYNLHEAKKYGQVYIVEGYCDALSLIASGFPNVVAAMGTSFTSDHINLLNGKELILALDNDKAGQDTMFKLIVSNRDIPFKVFKWVGAKDFNDLLVEDTFKLMALLAKPNIITAPEFVIHFCKNNLDLSILENRNKFWIALATLIGANDKRYFAKYPVNTLYTPVAFDYYWTIVKRIIKGKRGK